MKQPHHIVVVAVLTIVFSVAAAPVAKAVETSLSQQIKGIDNCDVDQVYSGLGVHYTILPEQCLDQLPDPTAVLPQSDGGLQQTFANTNTTPGQYINEDKSTESVSNGDQGRFENTVAEPVAAWLGIGNPQASPANPVIATATMGTGTGLAIDAALFESRNRQRLVESIRRLIQKLLRFRKS